jgi:hypothetical protein
MFLSSEGAPMEIGDQVKVKKTDIQGPILDTEYNKSSKQLRHLVQWKDETSGEIHTRWFDESQLTEVSNG